MVRLNLRCFLSSWLHVSNGHGLLRLFVNVKLKNVRPRIVTDDIQIIFSSDDLGAIEFGNQNRFSLRMGSGKEISKRVDDATAAAAHNGAGVFPKDGAIVGREITTAIELIAREHKTPPLDGNMTHGSDPGIARVGGRRAINLDSFCIHGRAHQGQIVLPANYRAKPSEGRFKYRHCGTVTKSPHQAFGTRRHYFSMFAEQAAVRCEEKDRTIESAAIPFDYADDKVNVVAARGPSEVVNRRPGNVHAAFPVSAKILAASIRARADYRAEVESTGICGNKGLGKKRELRSLASGFVGKGVNFFQCSFAIKGDRSGLNDGHPDVLTSRHCIVFGSRI